MNICEDFLSDSESDSPFECETQEYVDSDKADSDLEIELYGQIYYLDVLQASTSTKSFRGDSSCIDISTIGNSDSLHSFKSKEEPVPDIRKNHLGLVRFGHFENSTPKDSLKYDFIAKKQKGKTVASNSGAKQRDSGNSVLICSDDDHDSDASIICLDSDEHCDSSSILLNINGEIHSADMILLDSTATSEEDSCDQNQVSPTSSDHEGSPKNSFSATQSVSNQNGDPWHIDHEDRFASVKKINRYHHEKRLFCNNCKKKGHLSKDCLEPKNLRCYMCGQNHVWSKCNRIMCGKCLEYGHSNERCRYKACDITCNLCKMKGHLMHECPDIWRRYHLTTTSETIVKGSRVHLNNQKKYCYNCGHEGHYGHECLKPRMIPDSFPTWPFVISYKDPSQYLKKRLKKANKGEPSNSSRHYDSYSRHRRNKKNRNRADGFQEMISELSGEHSQNSKKSRNKRKVKKQFKDDKYNLAFKGNDFHRSPHIIKFDEVHRSPHIIKFDEGSSKTKKRKRRDADRLYAFKRKKLKLNSTV